MSLNEDIVAVHIADLLLQSVKDSEEARTLMGGIPENASVFHDNLLNNRYGGSVKPFELQDGRLTLAKLYGHDKITGQPTYHPIWSVEPVPARQFYQEHKDVASAVRAFEASLR